MDDDVPFVRAFGFHNRSSDMQARRKQVMLLNPEIACAQLEFESYAHKTPGFRSTPWKLSRDILIHNEHVCSLEVFYLEEKTEWNGKPFLQEEKVLIEVIAERIGNIIEREWAEYQHYIKRFGAIWNRNSS